MEKRSARVSEAQWMILIDYLESNPNLARARGYNNSAQRRALASRLWQEVATLLNSEGSGTTKSPKDWSIYVSNYKSKLKKIVANINADATATGGGPPGTSTLSHTDRRFLALMGPGFGQTAPQVMVQPFPEEPSTSNSSTSQLVLEEMDYVSQGEQETVEIVVEIAETEEATESETRPAETDTRPAETETRPAETETRPAEVETRPAEPLLPRRSRQRQRLRTRPLAPLDEARRILSQVEMQRAAADAANARANEGIALNLGRLANVAENFLQHFISQINNSS
ncbi:uncharacterized protein LOC114360902 isoform X2 [Ostrinia furnacalis]|uniref:uncharacterized protein LOC114360901 isoform X2 n=1 Tax=Ostrinia furnacalis TaxID=93504 RepID=UPI00103A02E3|nr:uncharacterized protein LOC114360901 isoform X2 [Ostrinia furnacalis]XP_028171565.1 uncharacterized protein LOC114360902 isoform X2 [Ostrinia furnacalis]